MGPGMFFVGLWICGMVAPGGWVLLGGPSSVGPGTDCGMVSSLFSSAASVSVIASWL